MENNEFDTMIIPYTASTIGAIRSNLAGLKGFDTMALELIQNADDAEASEIIFNVTPEGLWVNNNSSFTSCGKLNTNPCPLLEAGAKRPCDFHAMAEIGNGSKLLDSGNIGRFGVGFTSTYQVTDNPQIYSSGIRMTLHPYNNTCEVKSVDPAAGTRFFLPWATQQSSATRKLLNLSPIKPSHIGQLIKDIHSALSIGLLFLKKVRRAELQQDGKTIIACNIKELASSCIKLEFSSGTDEIWYMMRKDVRQLAETLYHEYPRLQDRLDKTIVEIAIRTHPQPLTDGFLYAFLPTQQTSGLPLHINADFYPVTNRKSLVFSGGQHDQLWNDMLISEAAALIASNLEDLYKIVGPSQLWDIIKKALDLANQKQYPSCFNKFAENVKQKGKISRIALAYDGSIKLPREIFFAPSDSDDLEFSALLKLDITVIAPQLRPYFNALTELGACSLKLTNLLPHARKAFVERFKISPTVSKNEYSSLYKPLWKIVDKLIPIELSGRFGNTKPPASLIELQELPIIITENYRISTMANSIKSIGLFSPNELIELIPTLPIANHSIHEYPNLAKRIDELDFHYLVNFLYKTLHNGAQPEEIIPNNKLGLIKFYDLLTDFDNQAKGGKNNADYDYTLLRRCQIWKPYQDGFVTLEEAVLPGDFQDPTDLSHLLDPGFLSEKVQRFLQNKLGVKRQTYEEFVKLTVPKLFNQEGPVFPEKFSAMIEDMANHTALLEQQEIVDILTELPLAPNCDGGWNATNQIYIKTDELVHVLGDTPALWLDLSRVPEKKAVFAFYRNIGLLEKPSLKHLYERMEYISLYISPKPSDDAKKMSSEAFYAICEQYETQKDEKEFRNILRELKNTACFPADGDNQSWYLAEELYVPYRSEIIDSQVKILNFKNTQRLNSKLLYELGMKEPNTRLVIEHLRYCIKNNVAPRVDVYRFLNDIANDSKAFGERNLIQQLTGQPCIYISKSKCFVLPKRIYQILPDLGSYAFKIPEELESFRPLIRLLGIQDSPTPRDYVDILLEITNNHDGRSEPLPSTEYAVYKTCLSSINNAFLSDKLDDEEIDRLRESASILSLLGTPEMPDELLMNDSEWYAEFFGPELTRAFCLPQPEFITLYEELGIRRLSRASSIQLQKVIGQEETADNIHTILTERAEILARLLHDKASDIRNLVLRIITHLKVSSFEAIHIKITIDMGRNNIIESITQPSAAYFNPSKCFLYIQRPLDSRSWSHIYRAIFNELMPDEASSVVKSIILNMYAMMSLPLEIAHQMLTEADYPTVDDGGPIDETHANEPEVTELSEPDESDTNEESAKDPVVDQPPSSAQTVASQPDTIEPLSGHTSTPDIVQATAPKDKQAETDGRGSEEPIVPESPTEDRALKQPTSSPPKQTHVPENRPNYKVQRDNRLRSYVTQDQQEDTDQVTDPARSERRLAVEAAARQAVCQYEERHGRLSEQMAQTHPGYDIVSVDSFTRKKRLIEVKSISGIWNGFGVGLSDYQFNYALEHGDDYWLYVVENIASPGNERVYPINNPARKVNTFFYDDGWKNVANMEDADPKSRFIPGAIVEHITRGRGTIKSCSLRGTTVILEIEFVQSPGQTQRIPLNLVQIQVVEVEHG